MVLLESKYTVAKKFVNRERAIPTAVSREESDSEITSSSRKGLVSGTAVKPPFMILDDTSKSFPKFNANGSSTLIKFNFPGAQQEPTAHLKECITALTNYLVDEVPGRHLVGLRVRNTKNVQDKVTGISLRRRYHFKRDVIWDVLGKVIQSNARFGLTNRLEVPLHHVRMPAGNGRQKKKGWTLNVLSATKGSIVVEKASFLSRKHMEMGMD